jgi:DnaK suppressor protein
MQKIDLQQFRQKLESELLRLQGDNLDNGPGKNQQADANLNRSDLAHNYALRERRLALHNVEQEQKIQIEKALERIADGSYGSCAACGSPIVPGRLEIIPYAIYCINCQKEQEIL